MAAELRTDAGFVEGQDKLSFAAFVRGQTKHAVSISITPGEMESQDRLGDAELEMQREAMRGQYAVHYTEINRAYQNTNETGEADETGSEGAEKPDDDEPMAWG